MWCVKCGKEIPDGSRFCGKCGAAQPAAAPATSQPAPQYTPAPEKKEKNKAAMIVWIIAAVLIVAAIALLLIFVVFPDGIGSSSKPSALEDRNDEDEYADDTDEPAEDLDEAAEQETAVADTEEPTTDNETPADSADYGYEVGDAMYDFSVPTIDGGTFTLSENLGKPVFINIFATWCPPCVGEMPDIEELYKEYGDYVTFIVVDEGEGLSTAQTFADENDYTLPFAYAEDGNFLQNYTLDFIPQTFVLDADGVIVEYFPGGSSLDAFESAITQALGVS